MGFSQSDIDKVWDKLDEENAQNEKDGFRKDQCSAWIRKSEYGNRDHKHGWEIDHITPKSKGGTDEISNLRALHWKNNAARQDGKLNTKKPAVKSVGVKNHELDPDTDEYSVM
ncbi:HNH endonuclease [Aeromonas hydrophila]|uniref:HNH endonuclease n=1 Tax=Aeromonas hydrophila TaxID=644 RepID=UPI001CF07DCF|nr:HNH endonuclease signature motif containing protein [Aeromonas hydrophila]UCM59913.1 HNH endonuclease [Aeromonas hydrophila]